MGCIGGCSSASLEAWRKAHGGAGYSGVSWWSTSMLCNSHGCAKLLGRGSTHLYLRDARMLNTGGP